MSCDVLRVAVAEITATVGCQTTEAERALAQVVETVRELGTYAGEQIVASMLRVHGVTPSTAEKLAPLLMAEG